MFFCKIKTLLLLAAFLLPVFLLAQKKAALITGRVINEEDKPLAGVSVLILNNEKNTLTTDSGYFAITVAANVPLAVVFSHVGYKTVQKNFNLNNREQERVTIKLVSDVNELKGIVITDQRDREQPGLINIDASKALINPSPISGVESLVKIFVGSNNELTSQYSVRGGNYDENLVYVNDFEVYRPYLVNSGQQEGLSFINPELTGNVKFYNGGYQAKYGDKMSSVLDVTYKKPTENSGSAYIGLLEQGFHLEGINKNRKITYLFGVRNRSNRNLLSSQETKGNYIPSSSDLQALVTWQANRKWRFEAFVNLSQTRFTFFPQESQQTAAVFSPLFAQSLGLDIFFQGQEKDKYSTGFIGLSAINQLNSSVQLKWMLSHFNDNEQQNVDISGAYLFGERDFDQNSATYGLITNPLGAGVNQNYTRDVLNIDVWNASLKATVNKGMHFIQFGSSIEKQFINDHLHEWTYNDSAGYSLPHNPSRAALFSSTNGGANIDITRFEGYAQDNIQFKGADDFTAQLGVRYNYNTLNKEWLLSPRAGLSFKPKKWKKDVIFKAAAGIYDQPPFYREMRRYDGSLNTNLKAQKSYQVTAGFDYNFKMFKRPARFTTEAYYKYMTDVDPYDANNVHIQYFGENNARAYAAGIEGRLFGEIVKDAESWLSVGIMRTMENINNDYYTTYKNAEGQTITANTQDQKPVDSAHNSVGWLRRPTDRLVTFGMFFQDYLSTNKNFKVYINLLYGSNLPYNIAGSTRYRNALTIEPYIRIDIGFSALLLSEKSLRRSHSPFKNFDNIWASFEVFNLIDRDNTISYTLVKDFANDTYAIPNRLTPRLVNFKVVAKW